MVYLKSFTYPTKEREWRFFMGIKRTCYDSFYPFNILSNNQLETISFEPITILYGENGSGKSTALHIIAEKLNLKRDSIFNKTNFYSDYLALCEAETAFDKTDGFGRMITSDDVFDYMLNIRTLNEGIDKKREDLLEEYVDIKYADFEFRSLEDYDHLKKVNMAKSKTQSKFIRKRLTDNIRTFSNGESAFQYFTEKMQSGGLYLLDEPENSLSPKRQEELVRFLEDSVRFFDCQLVIATHSPFLLSMRGAKIYNLDENPVVEKRWTDLPNIQTYQAFFQAHKHEFE